MRYKLGDAGGGFDADLGPAGEGLRAIAFQLRRPIVEFAPFHLQLVAALLGLELRDYSATQMSYDLRRLRSKGLIFSRPGTRRYSLTPYGWKVARLFSRLEARVVRPAIAAFGDEPGALPRPLRAPLKKVDRTRPTRQPGFSSPQGRVKT